MCEQTPIQYKNGDIVWVKLGNCWWPGEVKEWEELPNDVKVGFKKPPLAAVKFFQEDSYEYVKNISQIYSYNCKRKNDFIRKGLNMFRAKNLFMDKFPEDVCTAELRTGGNPDILSDPMFEPEKKPDYNAIFGSPSPKRALKDSNRNSRGRPSTKNQSSAKKSPASDRFVTHKRFLGHDDHEVRVLVQPTNSEEPETSTYNCPSCGFISSRIDVIVLHNKSHIQGVYSTPISTTKKPKRSPVKASKKVKKMSASKTATIDEDLALIEKGVILGEATSDDDEEEEPKPKKKRKTQSAKKKAKKPEQPTKLDITNDLLAEWNEDSDYDDAESSYASQSETPSKQAIEQIIGGNAITKKDDKSCFDFEEEEDSCILEASGGRKIPRVIPTKEESPKTKEELAKIKEGSPKKKEELAKIKEGSPKKKEELAKIKEESPKKKEELPKTKEEPPKTKEESPQTKEESPKKKEEPPKKKEEPPKTKEESPKINKEASKAKEESPKMKEDSPKTKEKIENVEYSKPKDDALKKTDDILKEKDEIISEKEKEKVVELPKVRGKAEKLKVVHSPKGKTKLKELRSTKREKESDEKQKTDVDEINNMAVSVESVLPKSPEKIKEDEKNFGFDFEAVMESTSVPKLPSIPSVLKCEQNFHSDKTIKFPDKDEKEKEQLPSPKSPKKAIERLRRSSQESPSRMGPSITAEIVPIESITEQTKNDIPETSKTEPVVPKQESKESNISETATKLINPKKRFVKNYEESELEQKKQLEKQEPTLTSNVEVSKLKTQLMNKLQKQESPAPSESTKTPRRTSKRSSVAYLTSRNEKESQEAVTVSESPKTRILRKTRKSEQAQEVATPKRRASFTDDSSIGSEHDAAETEKKISISEVEEAEKTSDSELEDAFRTKKLKVTDKSEESTSRASRYGRKWKYRGRSDSPEVPVKSLRGMRSPKAPNQQMEKSPSRSPKYQSPLSPKFDKVELKSIVNENNDTEEESPKLTDAPEEPEAKKPRMLTRSRKSAELDREAKEEPPKEEPPKEEPPKEEPLKEEPPKEVEKSYVVVEEIHETKEALIKDEASSGLVQADESPRVGETHKEEFSALSVLSTLAAEHEPTPDKSPNLTVVTEADLAEGQVEITAPSQSPIIKSKPVTLSSFSVDFCDSGDSSDFQNIEIVVEPPKTETVKSKSVPSIEAEKPSVKSDESVNIDKIAAQSPPPVPAKTEEAQPELKKTSRLLQVLTEPKPKKMLGYSQKLVSSGQVKRISVPPNREFPAVTKSVARTELKHPKLVVKSTIPSTKLLSEKSNKPLILSEKVIKSSKDTESVSVQKVQSSKNANDIEDITTYIIQRSSEKPVTIEEDTISKRTPVSTRGRGKARILQQTIITPSGDVIQPSSSTSQDDNVFDINSMPIVMGDQIITPESIENMPVVISDSSTATSTTDRSIVTIKKTPTQQLKLLNKSSSPHVASQPSLMKSSSITPPYKLNKTQKIYQASSSKLLKSSPAVITQQGRPEKFIIVPTSSSSPSGSKFTVGKRPPLIRKSSPVVVPSASTTNKVQSVAEPTGNKILIVTNQEGKQSRVLLTPAQQKLFGYQTAATKVTKTAKGNVAPKTTVPSKNVVGISPKSTVVSHTVINSKGQLITTSGQSLITSDGQVLTPVSSQHVKGLKQDIKPQTKKVQMHPQRVLVQSGIGQVKTGQQKTVVIKNQQGQIVKRIQGTDDALLEQQVAEQVQAIKASSSFNALKKQEAFRTQLTRPPLKKSYAKKTEALMSKPQLKMSQVQKVIKSEGIPPLAPISPNKKVDVAATISAPFRIEETPGPQEDKTAKPETQQRPLHQLIIQDGLGNQTVITEGQILAIPSETVDGQPHSYMLVTLDESGSLTPLNNEALLSLDPNLGLGGDLSNMVLQIDEGGASDSTKSATIAIPKPPQESAPVPQTPVVPEIVEKPAVQEIEPEQHVLPVIPETAGGAISAEPANQNVDNVQTVTCSINSDPNQQLIITGDPISTQKFIESLTEGNADLANLLASAEGNILIHADGQQILINTDSENQLLLPMGGDSSTENSEAVGNPIFASQPTKSQDILAAALADTDVSVFQQEQTISTHSKLPQSQLSPNSLYPMVGNILEPTLTISSPIMTPLEVPSTNNKKIPDEVSNILTTEVPKNVDLPITITDPNISQTVAQSQAASLMAASELQTNLELPLAITEPSISAPSSEMNSPSFVYSLPSLDESVDINQKPFSSSISMPLLTEEPEEAVNPMDITVTNENKLQIVDDDVKDETCNQEQTGIIKGQQLISEDVDTSEKTPAEELATATEGDGTFMAVEEGLCTLGGEMCSSLSEPPPDMFDLSIMNSRFSSEEVKESIGEDILEPQKPLEAEVLQPTCDPTLDNILEEPSVEDIPNAVETEVVAIVEENKDHDAPENMEVSVIEESVEEHKEEELCMVENEKLIEDVFPHEEERKKERIAEVQAIEKQNTEVQTNEEQNTEVLASERQNAEVPANETHNTEVQANETQSTEVQASETQTTEVQANETQITEVQTNETQNTEMQAKEEECIALEIPKLNDNTENPEVANVNNEDQNITEITTETNDIDLGESPATIGESPISENVPNAMDTQEPDLPIEINAEPSFSMDESSCEIPVQPQIITDLSVTPILENSHDADDAQTNKRNCADDEEIESKNENSKLD